MSVKQQYKIAYRAIRYSHYTLGNSSGFKVICQINGVNNKDIRIKALMSNNAKFYTDPIGDEYRNRVRDHRLIQSANY